MGVCVDFFGNLCENKGFCLKKKKKEKNLETQGSIWALSYQKKSGNPTSSIGGGDIFFWNSSMASKHANKSVLKGYMDRKTKQDTLID